MTICQIAASTPPLESPRLFLSRITENDAKGMYAYSKKRKVTKYLTWMPHKSLSFTRRYIQLLQEKYESAQFYDWGVHTKEDGRFIGTCGFTKLDEARLLGEIGYVFSPKIWGRGFATEACRTVMEFGFNVLGLKEICARYLDGNSQSEAVMRRLGMKPMGVLPNNLYVKGRWCAVWEYRITREEFSSRHN